MKFSMFNLFSMIKISLKFKKATACNLSESKSQFSITAEEYSLLRDNSTWDKFDSSSTLERAIEMLNSIDIENPFYMNVFLELVRGVYRPGIDVIMLLVAMNFINGNHNNFNNVYRNINMDCKKNENCTCNYCFLVDQVRFIFTCDQEDCRFIDYNLLDLVCNCWIKKGFKKPTNPHGCGHNHEHIKNKKPKFEI